MNAIRTQLFTNPEWMMFGVGASTVARIASVELSAFSMRAT
jgi:hypothetical protein